MVLLPFVVNIASNIVSSFSAPTLQNQTNALALQREDSSNAKRVTQFLKRMERKEAEKEHDLRAHYPFGYTLFGAFGPNGTIPGRNTRIGDVFRFRWEPTNYVAILPDSLRFRCPDFDVKYDGQWSTHAVRNFFILQRKAGYRQHIAGVDKTYDLFVEVLEDDGTDVILVLGFISRSFVRLAQMRSSGEAEEKFAYQTLALGRRRPIIWIWWLAGPPAANVCQTG